MLNNQDIKDIRLLGSFTNYLIHRTRDLILNARLATAGETYEFVSRQLQQNGMSGETLGYRGYSRPFCLSLNHNVLHGLNEDSVVFNEDDVIRLDMVVGEKHLLVDCAITFSPKPSKELEENLEVAKRALHLAKNTLNTSTTNLETGKTTEFYVKTSGKHLLDDFYGHSINPTMHAGEIVPTCYDPTVKSFTYRLNQTYTVEPVVTSMKTDYIIDKKDGWSVFCQDKNAVHVEDTFLITFGKPENITKCHI
jgi:methionyl aminopeptidase